MMDSQIRHVKMVFKKHMSFLFDVGLSTVVTDIIVVFKREAFEYWTYVVRNEFKLLFWLPEFVSMCTLFDHVQFYIVFETQELIIFIKIVK